jgi:uncharacterized protein DUF5076
MPDEPLQELEVPEGVLDAEHAVEVLRAWIADGALHVIFEPGSFGQDVSEWGRLLSEVSHHIASGVALEGHLSQNEALTAIHEAYERGVLEPTGTRTGQVKRKVQH